MTSDNYDDVVNNAVYQPKLPPNGTRVIAMALGSIEYDQEPWETEGELYTQDSPLGLQCFVGGVSCDPTSVRVAGDAPESNADAPQTLPDAENDLPPVADPNAS